MAADKTEDQDQSNSQPTQTPTSPPPSQPRPKRQFLKITGIVVGVLILAFILIAIFVPASVPKYSTSDLVTQTSNGISFSRPQQWQDASNVTKLKKDFGLGAGNTSVYGDKIVKDSDGQYDVANAFLIFGQVNSTPTDLEILKQPAFKTEFEKLMNNQLQADTFKSSTCASVTDYSINYSYDLNNFPVSVALKFDCQLSEAEQKHYDADAIKVHMAVVIAKDGKTYLYTLIATDKSWAKNEPVYLQMLRDFKGQ